MDEGSSTSAARSVRLDRCRSPKSQIIPSTCPFVITWRHFDGTESECRALLRAVAFAKKRELCIVEAIDETLRIPMIAASPSPHRADRHQRAELLPWRALDRPRTILRHPSPRSSRQSNKTAQLLCEPRSIPRCCQCRPVTTAERVARREHASRRAAVASSDCRSDGPSIVGFRSFVVRSD
jgi:hypothetical protein